MLNRKGCEVTDEGLNLSRVRAAVMAEIPIYRKKRKMAQKQLAEKLGVSQMMISKLENGGFNPTVKLLNSIVYALGGSFSIHFSLGTESVKEKKAVSDETHIPEHSFALNKANHHASVQ